MPDAISPELVLVDPALARQERARLDESARLTAFLAKSSPAEPVDARAGVHQAGPRWRLRSGRVVLAGLIVASLTANAALAALLISQNEPSTAQEPASAAAGVDAAAGPIRSAAPGVAGRRTTTPVERHVLRWLTRMPAPLLPRALRQEAGRSASDLAVDCRRRTAARSYRCHVWVRDGRIGPSLLVEYPAPAEGGALVTWAK